MGKIQEYARWSEWEGSVLAKVKDPQRCQQIIAKRQRTVDDDQDEADLVADHIREKLRNQKLKPEDCCVFIRTSQLAVWITELKGSKMPLTRVTPYLKTLGIPELQTARRSEAAGWIWRGPIVKKSRKPVDLEKIQYLPLGDG